MPREALIHLQSFIMETFVNMILTLWTAMSEILEVPEKGILKRHEFIFFFRLVLEIQIWISILKKSATLLYLSTGITWQNHAYLIENQGYLSLQQAENLTVVTYHTNKLLMILTYFR